MPKKIIIEQHLRKHPRVLKLLQKFPQARVLFCERYTEVFNPKGQNFRLQKANPALIIAEKHAGRVLPAPDGFGIGGQHNYYFSHLLNCPYDCRYCFLQGMYRSANYVWFINYEDYMQDILKIAAQHASEASYFFSGYDADSLALDPLTLFVEEFIQFFSQQDRAVLELRTKSCNVRTLLKYQPSKQVVVAFSLTPDLISRGVEHKVPSLVKRLQAMHALAQAGWQIGLRFDPLVDAQDFSAQYRDLLQQIFTLITPGQVHSVSLGPLRFPAKMLDKISRLYPEEPLLAAVHAKHGQAYAYSKQREAAMLSIVRGMILQHVPEERLFRCYV